MCLFHEIIFAQFIYFLFLTWWSNSEAFSFLSSLLVILKQRPSMSLLVKQTHLLLSLLTHCKILLCAGI